MTKKIITISNPSNLPTIDFHKLRILQGDLKTLSKENLTKLCNSILKLNYFVPAFIWNSDNDLWILDATQRYHALEQLEKEGYEIPEIPYIEIEAKDRKDAAEKLLQITSRYGEINPETTFFEDFDIDLSFINDVEIPELDIKLEELAPETVEDEVPKPPTEPLSKTGDLWLCGKHRILCGGATKEADIRKLMDGKKADIVFCDAPYNMGKDFANDNLGWAEYLKFCEDVFNNIKNAAKAIFAIYWFGNFESLARIFLLFKDYFGFKREIVWYKSVSQGLDRFPQTCEYALYGEYGDVKFNQDVIRTDWHEYNFKEGLQRNIYEDIKEKGKESKYNKEYRDKQFEADLKIVTEGIIPKNVWFIKNRQGGFNFGNSEKMLHVSEKPIELCVRAILPVSKENDIIADFFLGSGTTLIAAHQTECICYGCEIDPHYIDVILDRYAKFTGNNPIREDGVKWSELKSSKVVS